MWKTKKFWINCTLIVAVTAIWGWIATVFLPRKEAELPTTAIQDSDIGNNIDSLISYEPDYNYRDPFFGSTKKSVISKPKVQPKARPLQHIPISIEKWPDVRYYGVIHNKAKDEYTAIVSIDNQQHLLNGNDIIDNVCLAWVSEDSIGLRRGVELRVVHKTY